MFTIEDVISEMILDHDMQKGEILSLISGYIDVHFEDAIEVYEDDNSSPIFFYGSKNELVKRLTKEKKNGKTNWTNNYWHCPSNGIYSYKSYIYFLIT